MYYGVFVVGKGVGVIVDKGKENGIHKPFLAPQVSR